MTAGARIGAAALWLAACADPADPADDTARATSTGTPTGSVETSPACLTDTFVVEIGTGEVELRLLEDGDTVELVHGPQGGWHVEVAARVTGAGAAILVLPALRVAETGLAIGVSGPPTYLVAADWSADDCVSTFVHEPGFVDDVVPTDQAFICSLEGAELDYQLTITDVETDAAVTDQVRVIAALDPDDLDACAAAR